MNHLPTVSSYWANASIKRLLHSTSVAIGRTRFPFYNRHKKVTDPARQDPEYFENVASSLPLDEHYVDALGKLYTEKIGSEREVYVKGDDRLIGRDRSEWLPHIDRCSPRLAFGHVDVLTTAPDTVKRIFSVEYGTRRDLTDAWKKSLIDKVKKHELDKESLEMKIAWLTSLIRHWSDLIEEINNIPKKPTWLTRKLFLVVDFRRKLLRQLRENDSQAFEKVLSELKIAYHVPKLPEQMVEKRRKAWAEAQLKERVEREKEKQLTELYKRFLTNREETEKEINRRLDELDGEKKKIEQRLMSIAELEGDLSVKGPKKYRPHLIDSLSKAQTHLEFFYHPKPTMTKAYGK